MDDIYDELHFFFFLFFFFNVSKYQSCTKIEREKKSKKKFREHYDGF